MFLFGSCLSVFIGDFEQVFVQCRSVAKTPVKMEIFASKANG